MPELTGVITVRATANEKQRTNRKHNAANSKRSTDLFPFATESCLSRFLQQPRCTLIGERRQCRTSRCGNFLGDTGNGAVSQSALQLHRSGQCSGSRRIQPAAQPEESPQYDCSSDRPAKQHRCRNHQIHAQPAQDQSESKRRKHQP
jgi:hypothetical protein